jgi:hypothetical protein
MTGLNGVRGRAGSETLPGRTPVTARRGLATRLGLHAILGCTSPD